MVYTTGNNNIPIGNISGYLNTAIGKTKGANNTAIGNTIGTHNTAIGKVYKKLVFVMALVSTTGQNNIATGNY